MRARILRNAALIALGCFVVAASANSQAPQDETLGGPDSHETGQGPHGHLFGEWDGERTRLLERGVRFDFQYVSDNLWNLESKQDERFASWDRFRWTLDIDFGKLVGAHDLFFHATALWQDGGNLGAYLGLLTSPSGMSSMPTARLDSWWREKRWLNEWLTARIGQFAAQDFYGAQHYAASFIFEPMGYALGNLSRPKLPVWMMRLALTCTLSCLLAIPAIARLGTPQEPPALVGTWVQPPVSNA